VWRSWIGRAEEGNYAISAYAATRCVNIFHLGDMAQGIRPDAMPDRCYACFPNFSTETTDVIRYQGRLLARYPRPLSLQRFSNTTLHSSLKIPIAKVLVPKTPDNQLLDLRIGEKDYVRGCHKENRDSSLKDENIPKHKGPFAPTVNLDTTQAARPCQHCADTACSWLTKKANSADEENLEAISVAWEYKLAGEGQPHIFGSFMQDVSGQPTRQCHVQTCLPTATFAWSE